jgi:hypothetical protein
MLFLPWWVTGLLLVAGFYIFNRYIEGIIFAFFLDVLYGTSRALFMDFAFVSLLTAVALFALSDIMKKKLRFYDA